MDDKQLDKILDGLKNEYERLPELTRNFRNAPEDERKRRKRGKLYSYTALAAGIFLFLILALPSFSDYEQADISSNYLTSYYEKKKEEFRIELGVDSVDNFFEVVEAEELLATLPKEMTKEVMEHTKSRLDEIFTTPETMIGAFNSGKKELTEESIIDLFNKLRYQSYGMNDYFSRLKLEYQLKQADVEELYANQYNYNGPSEIVELLETVHQQGLQLVKTNVLEEDKFQVEVNYGAIVERVENWEGLEGMAEYLLLIDEKFDIHSPGVDNSQGIPWYEFDDILLELEEIYHRYPENRDLIFKGPYITNALYPAQAYLNDYLSTFMLEEGMWEEHRNTLETELITFIENHPESLYTPLVEEALVAYRENDWREHSFYNGSGLYILFDLMEKGIEYEGLIAFNRWPLSTGTMSVYNHYKESKDIEEFSRLNAFEFLSLYMYVSNIDKELYDLLRPDASSYEKIDWIEVYSDSQSLAENRVNENTIEYIFIGKHGEPIGLVGLAATADGWKVTHQNLYEFEW